MESLISLVIRHILSYTLLTGAPNAEYYERRIKVMNKLTYCPFINGTCRSDCVFHTPFNIALNNGNSAQCELAAFVSCSDEDAVKMVANSLKHLHPQSE